MLTLCSLRPALAVLESCYVQALTALTSSFRRVPSPIRRDSFFKRLFSIAQAMGNPCYNGVSQIPSLLDLIDLRRLLGAAHDA